MRSGAASVVLAVLVTSLSLSCQTRPPTSPASTGSRCLFPRGEPGWQAYREAPSGVTGGVCDLNEGGISSEEALPVLATVTKETVKAWRATSLQTGDLGEKPHAFELPFSFRDGHSQHARTAMMSKLTGQTTTDGRYDGRRDACLSNGVAYGFRSQYGEKLTLTCAYAYDVRGAYDRECRASVVAALAMLSARWASLVCPFELDAVAYDKRGTCFDTFIPGCEAADCFDFLVASVPVRWRDGSDCGTPRAASPPQPAP